MSNKKERCEYLLDICDTMWKVNDYDNFEWIYTLLEEARDKAKYLMDIDSKNGIYVYTLLFNYLAKISGLRNEAIVIADELERLHNAVEMEKE